MMKNKNIPTSSDCDEFQCLLDNFLQNNSSSPQVEPEEETAFTTCLYKGQLYDVPAPREEGNPVFKACSVTFSFGLRSVKAEEGAIRLFLPGRNEEFPELTVTVKLAEDENESASDADLLCCLYRQGERIPVASATDTPDTYENKLCFSFPMDRETFRAGGYFLVISRLSPTLGITPDEWLTDGLNGHICLSFRLLPAGEQLAHPSLRSAEFFRSSGELTAGGFTSGSLTVRIHAASPLPVGNEFSLCCYTQEWNLMANAEHYFSQGKREARHVDFRLHATRIWVPGDYFAVLSHNREPYALLTFTYRGQAADLCECRLLTGSDPEFWMVKHLEQEPGYKWSNVRGFQGLFKMKPRLVELARAGGFNRFCSLHRVDMLRSNLYTVITSSVPFYAKRLAYCLPGLLSFGTQSYRQVDCADWVAAPDEATTALEERADRTLCLYNLSALLNVSARPLLAALTEAACNGSLFWALILCGTHEEVERLFRQAPALAVLFTEQNHFDILYASAAELVHLTQACIAETPFHLSAAAEHVLTSEIFGLYERVYSWQKKDIQEFLNDSVFLHLKQRLQELYNKQHITACTHITCASHAIDGKALTTIDAADFHLSDYLEKKDAAAARVRSVNKFSDEFEQAMRELNDMVGLDGLKEELTTTFLQIRFGEQRKRFGLPTDMEGTHHMIFTGNPGTGKTTVAKLIGKIYHALGLLSKGEVIVTERSKLVGRYIGQTEETMSEVLKQAKGNVLFIDEAYTLCDTLEDRKDYGNRVIESLLTVLAEPHPDMIVILAGYSDEMERLMQMNQGLLGRFPHHFHFDDYTADELIRIARNLLERKCYVLTSEADELLTEAICRTLRHKDRSFCNARWINQFFLSGALPAMARRLMLENTLPTQDMCQTIERVDVEQAMKKFCISPAWELKPQRKIGFRA